MIVKLTNSCIGMNSRKSSTRVGKPVVVVEIGHDWLKLLQVDSGRTVSRMHLEELDSPGGASPEAIAGVFKKLKLATGRIQASLPRQLVNIRMLELPSTDPAELADMVDLQVGKQTPYSREEIVSGYRVIGAGREGYSRVMLAIVQRSVLRQRFAIMEEAGFEIDRMSVSSEGLLNWCVRTLPKDSDGTIAVLDVDSFFSDLTVVSKGRLLFSRSIRVGANQLLHSDVDTREKFVREVRHSVEACAGELPDLSIGRLYVTGAGPNVGGLADDIGKELNVTAENVDSLQNFSRTPGCPSPQDAPYHAVSLTPLLGIAMAPESLSLNLVPDSVRLRKGLVVKARSLTALGVLIMAAMISASAYLTTKLFIKTTRLQRVETEIRNTEPAVQNVRRWREIIHVATGRADLRFSAYNLLAEIHARIPAGLDLALDSVFFEIEKGVVQLGGSSGTTEDIRALVGNLEQSLLLQDVNEGGTTVKGRDGRWRFRLDCALERKEE